ncbi:hypothetical protein Droror1_Dr00024642 [Drosera rotundifolia]
MASSSSSPSPEPQSSGSKALSSLYSNYLLTRLSALISHLNLALNPRSFYQGSPVWPSSIRGISVRVRLGSVHGH